MPAKPTVRESAFIAASRRTKLSPRNIKAARMVMVLGVGYAQAAKQSGLAHRQAVYRAVNCIRRALNENSTTCRCCGQPITHNHQITTGGG